MPLAPTPAMRRLAARRLTDTIRLYTETTGDDVNPTTFAHNVTVSDEWIGAGLVHQLAASWQPGTGRVFGLRELGVWLADDAVPTVGMRCELVATGDVTLDGKTGTVIEVERASQRAVRRTVIRLDDET